MGGLEEAGSAMEPTGQDLVEKSWRTKHPESLSIYPQISSVLPLGLSSGQICLETPKHKGVHWYNTHRSATQGTKRSGEE